MELTGSHVVRTNEYVPFTATLNNWAVNGDSYLIRYDPEKRLIRIPHASKNDYYIHWEISLYTATINEYPILGLEFSYPGFARCDYFIAPTKQMQIANCALYRIKKATALQEDDNLIIGLKVIGEDGYEYVLNCYSEVNISGHIEVFAL